MNEKKVRNQTAKNDKFEESLANDSGRASAGWVQFSSLENGDGCGTLYTQTHMWLMVIKK